MYFIIEKKTKSIIAEMLHIMRFYLFFLMVGVMQAFGSDTYSKTATLTFQMNNVSIENVLNTIEDQSEFRFLYNKKIVDVERKVNISADNLNINQVLDNLFYDTEIAYIISDRQIVLNKKDAFMIEQQTRKVTGLVTDSNGEAVLGATVMEKGVTNSGTVTDVNGKFSLSVGEKAVLQVSYLGYVSQEITVGNQTNLNITLQEDSQILDEVVIVGYGTQKKVNLSGAVSTISSKVLENRPVTNVNQALQGLAPGMNISVTEGRANSAAEINVRGYTSINDAKQASFILVDNVPVSAEELGRINPADVENVSVLKDAAAAAIYGARAAYGVVLITTRTAKSEKLEIDAEANYGVRQVYGKPDVIIDPYIFMQYTYEAGYPLRTIYSQTQRDYAKQRSENPSLPAIINHPDNPGYWDYYSATDWWDEGYSQTAGTYTANVRIAQKGERLRYVMSGGYYQQDGILNQANDVLKRYNFRGNGTYKMTKWWEVGSNISFVHSNYDSPSVLDHSFYEKIYATPDVVMPLYNPDGTYTNTGADAMGLLTDGGRTLNRVNETQVSLNTTVDILKDVWTLKGDANFRFANTNQDKTVLPVEYREGPELPLLKRGMDGTNSYADLYAIENRYTVFNLYTDYHKTFAQKHFVQGLVGFNQEYQYYNRFTTRRMNLVSSSLPSVQLATGTVTNAQTINELALQGFFYRLNYIFDNKYILELDGRSDGTSRYPSNSRWGFFPSGSAAWVLSRESFMTGVNEALKISHLKIRGSYGELGNQVMYDTSGNAVYYPYLATMESKSVTPVIEGAQPLGVFPPGTVAGDLTWERVRTVNGGIDLTFFNNRLELSFERYNRYTEGMLTKSKTLPGIFGTSEPQTNAADLKTEGWELTIGYRDKVNVGGSPLTYGARFMLWDNRSWITKYDNPNRLISDYYEGQELGEIWGLTTLGFFQTDAEVADWFDQTNVGSDDTQYKFYAGDLKFANINGDNVISYGDNTVDNPGDRKIIGNSSVRLPYTIDLTADWKGFDLRLFFSGVGKRDWYPEAQYIPFWGSLASPWLSPQRINLDHWTTENPDAYFPRTKQYIAEDYNGTTKIGSELSTPQTRYLQDGSFLRLKNITLGYTLPQGWMEKAKISRLRVYFSGENLWTPVSNIVVPEIDPESIVNSRRGKFYPQQRVWALGLNLSF